MTRVQVLLLAALLCLPGCIPSWLQGAADAPAELQSFTSEQAFRDYFKAAVLGPTAAATQPAYPSYTTGTTITTDPLADTQGGLEPTSPVALPDPDLPALARTDGTYTYIITDYDLSVVQADPPDQLKVLGRFSLKDWLRPTALYLFGHRAVVVTDYNYAYDYGWTYMIGDKWLPDGESFFQVAVIDVQDPANPQLLRQYAIQGQPLASQVVDGRLVMVSASYPAGSNGDNTNLDFNNLATGDILPKYRMVDENSNDTVGPLVTWDAVRRPANPDGSAVMAITTLDVTGAPASPTATAVMAFWQYLYVTPRSLYMFNTPYTPANEYRTDAEIHKYSLAGTVAQYAASGKVAARPPYYWYTAFSEKDDRLRVLLSPMDQPGYNLAILQQDRGKLQVSGQIDNIAPDLDLNYLIFAGDHLLAYGTDPTVPPQHFDLSDPAAPQATGPMDLGKVSGTMHMLDDTHLLVLGNEIITGDPSGQTYGDLCLWMFDLANTSKPALLHQQVIGSGATSSAATATHDNLTLTGGLLALPVDLYEGTYPANVGVHTFSGQYIYRVSVDKGFEQLGRIATANALYYDAWERVFFQNNAVYVISNAAAKAAAMSNPDTLISDIRVPGL